MTSPETEGHKLAKPWIKFDPSISIGHLLTTIALAAAVIGWGVGIEKTITSHSERLSSGALTDIRIEKLVSENRNDIREVLKEIKDELKEIRQKLEATRNQRLP